MATKIRESMTFRHMNADLIFQKSMAWILEIETADVVIKLSKRNPDVITCIIMMDIKYRGKYFTKYFELQLNIMVDSAIMSFKEIESSPRNRRFTRIIRQKFREIASQYREYISPRKGEGRA